ncbi:cytochrome c [Gemmata sp. G18]|uniref:Cytochrome c n=1 Tax=Gemmata palustris TaxID=2822762 RepID=A0ABS5C2M3_9BACT|nr:cytochrome c [Gemmata palustris]MBP3960234.1 cytochrome c [Gemmata palustris]
MRRFVFALSLFGAALLAANGLTADEPKKTDAKLTKKDLGKMMKDAHHGAKSPHARTAAELKKDAPDWEEITKDVKAFVAMGEAFQKVNLNYTSPAKYIESTTALSKAAGGKDKKAATEAFTGLTKSCASCHFYGGAPGGLEK